VIAYARSKQVIHRKSDVTKLSWSWIDLSYKPFVLCASTWGLLLRYTKKVPYYFRIEVKDSL